LITTRPEALHPTIRTITERATAFSAADAFAGRYRLAELRRATEPVWLTIDALCVPTFPRPHTLAALAADPIGPNAELGTYTNFVNLLDLCALAVPSHPRADGAPAGVTLIAPAGRDATLVPLGDGLHRAGGTPMGATGAPLPQAPEAGPPRATGDEIELAVVGAHLSGLPLNGELTSLGARHLRAVTTTPDYRLFALPGAGPRRPGLVRVAAGTGTSITTEVWALTPDAFGRFVAAIPAPLGIGTLRLADGTSPKGFLCEPEGVREAEDVSAHGGWRAYLAAGRAG
jgi:allophanate hydrolase